MTEPGKPTAQPAPADDGGREGLKLWGTLGLLAVAGFLVAWQFVGPAPPDSLVLATGSERGAYHAYGLRYAAELSDYGVTVELRTTAGSLENVRLLQTGEVDVAFVQGGTVPTGNEGLESIASLYYEPLWLFHRPDVELEHVGDLAGRRIQVGDPSSGTFAVAAPMLTANGVGPQDAVLEHLSTEGAVQQLLGGSLDAAFLVISPDSEAIGDLMDREGDAVRLMDLPRWLAYVRTWPHLAHVVLAEGVLDLDRNIPDRDVDLVAPTAALVATEDLHPALVPVFIQAAKRIHGGGDIFSPPGSFPSPEHLEAPLSVAADQYFEKGASFLYRVLPFSVAAAIDRLKILMLPLLTLLLPLLRVAGPLYRWRIRRKIYRWYAVLKGVENRFLTDQATMDVSHYLGELDKVRLEIAETVSVPASYMEELYNLRMHVDRVHDEIAQPDGRTPT